MAYRLGRGRILSILFSTLLLGRAIAVRGLAEVRVELQMERWAARGGSVRLRCLHDVPPHLLDKVVFLRHGTKIFQYIRNRKPPYRNFTTPGAVLNIALATNNSITLQNLDFAASGIYSCEVSLDTPIYTKASPEKQLTVFHPQKHNPRIDFPTRFLSSGEVLRANCTSSPALPAPHITWFINGKKMDEVVTRLHKFRVPLNDRSSSRRGFQHVVEHDSSRPISESKEFEKAHVPGASSRHRGRHDLYVSVSELRLVATGRLDIVCVSTIPEFRSIDDKFADVKNDTVIVDVIRPSTFLQPSANLSVPESSTSIAALALPYTVLSYLIIILHQLA